MYKPHPLMSRTPNLEAQNLEKNKNNTVGNFSRVVLLQKIKVLKHQHRSCGYLSH